MADNDIMKPEDAQLAIAKASQQRPKVQLMRDKLRQLAEDEEKGLPILASAIRNLLHQE